MDEYNQALIDNVAPEDWQNPEPVSKYNLVVIGAGSAGLVTAAGAAGLGAKVALVEKHLLGGDCLNYGCVPSKSLIRSAIAYAHVREARRYGVVVPNEVKVDFPAVMERMRKIRAQISQHDSVKRFTDLGVDVFLGSAKFRDDQTVEVGDKTLKFSKAVIATGSRAASLPIPGLKEAGFLTNETIFSLTQLPRRLLVIGAGPIGSELAQAFSRFGSEVLLFEGMHGLLPKEDRDAAELLYKSFKQDGIQFICCCRIEKIEKRSDGKAVYFSAAHDGKTTKPLPPQEVSVDEILVAVGRLPNVEGLNLEAVGVEYDKFGVKVNDYLQTTNPNIYAAGDICLPYKFTHTADATGRIVIQNALFYKSKKKSSLTVPWVTYTDPEIAHVGLYEKDAQEKGIEVETFVREFKDVDRAQTDGKTEGFVKVHVKRGTDKIIGATIVHEHAGEMIHELSLAIVAGIGLGKISQVIHSYPTQAEAIRQCGDAYNRTKLTPFVKNIFQTWLRWKRS